MRAHLHDDIGIAEICDAACASRRSLQYCFEEFMHTTPQAYLRALRLNEARRALKLADGQPITALASELGFASASHFTRHYKLMFDELPSETLKAYGLNPTGGTRM
jgi:AraC family ethanolamine operon transcriptional activator